jgi:LemA protein
MHVGEILVAVLLLFGALSAVGYALTIYNGLVSLKNNIARSWSNIDVLLKQRHDELPKLVKTCEGYMQHERAVFQALGEARTGLMRARTIPERAQAESGLTQALGQFFAVAEAYPDLKANQNFMQLQNRISELENQIADRREYYNDVVATYNTRLDQIPDKFVADWCHYLPAELFKATDADRQDVAIDFKMSA